MEEESWISLEAFKNCWTTVREGERKRERERISAARTAQKLKRTLGRNSHVDPEINLIFKNLMIKMFKTIIVFIKNYINTNAPKVKNFLIFNLRIQSLNCPHKIWYSKFLVDYKKTFVINC